MKDNFSMNRLSEILMEAKNLLVSLETILQKIKSGAPLSFQEYKEKVLIANRIIELYGERRTILEHLLKTGEIPEDEFNEECKTITTVLELYKKIKERGIEKMIGLIIKNEPF
jgi:predicted AAA+ superfamily ATPase